MKITIKYAAVVLASIASLSTTANAAIVVGDLIAIDFGATATSTANYNISNFAASDVNNLIRNSDGASTGVSLTVAGATQDNLNAIAGNGGNTTDADIFADGILAGSSGRYEYLSSDLWSCLSKFTLPSASNPPDPICRKKSWRAGC